MFKKAGVLAALMATALTANADDYEECDDFPLAFGGLYNLSARGYMGAGQERLTAGFIIAGNEGICVAIRARGFDSVDIPNTGSLIRDPQFRLVSQSTREIIRANDNWAEDNPDVGLLVGYQLHHALGPNDAAVIECLAPGGYTVIGTPASGVGGNGILEVFDLTLREQPEPLGCKPPPHPIPEPECDDDEDDNNGHGNDCDRDDEGNPGNGNGKGN